MGKIDELTNEASAMQKPVSDIAERGGSGAIAQLIQQYCPDGVEYVKLGELCVKVCSGGTPSRGNGDYFTGNIPWFRTQEVDWRDIYDTEIKITEEAVNNSSAKLIPENCVIIAMYGATAGKVGINKIPLTTNQACCNLQINPQKALYKYVYYCVCNEYENLKSLGQGSQNNINAQIIKEYPIPLPPLPVQEEIVRILDNFTNLAAELQAELQARQQQYNYYRDTLLSFEGREDVQWKKLGEVLKIKNGRDYKHLNNGNVPVYGSGGVMTYVDTQVYDKPSVLIPRKGSIDKLYYVDCPFWNVDTIFYTEINASIVIEKYVFYILQKEHLEKLNIGGGVPSLTQKVLNGVVIPIPPLSEQQRIVDILDRFDTLVNDLSQGLPAEIEARQQQYEYSRDRLLTFNRKSE